MTTDISLPKIGFAMTEGMLVEWVVADGDRVVEGQVIYLLESDKSTQEVEAPAAGTISIAAAAGETYQVGDLLGTIE